MPPNLFSFHIQYFLGRANRGGGKNRDFTSTARAHESHILLSHSHAEHRSVAASTLTRRATSIHSTRMRSPGSTRQTDPSRRHRTLWASILALRTHQLHAPRGARPRHGRRAPCRRRTTASSALNSRAQHHATGVQELWALLQRQPAFPFSPHSPDVTK